MQLVLHPIEDVDLSSGNESQNYAKTEYEFHRSSVRARIRNDEGGRTAGLTRATSHLAESCEIVRTTTSHRFSVVSFEVSTVVRMYVHYVDRDTCVCNCCFSVSSQSDTESVVQLTLHSPCTHSGSKQALSQGSSQQRVFRSKHSHTDILQTFLVADSAP